MPSRLNEQIINNLREFIQANPQLCNDLQIAREYKNKTNSPLSVQQLRLAYVPVAKDNSTNISNFSDNKIITESETDKVIEYKGEKSITSLEEAIEYFEVDTTIWDVKDWKCKSWDTSMKIEEIKDGQKVLTPIKKTNYAVTVNLKKKDKEVDYQSIYSKLDEYFKPSKRRTLNQPNTKIGVLSLGDLHIGLKVNKAGYVVNVPDYSIDIVINRLKKIAENTNALNYSELHVNILGDLVESVTGYNKIETLKEMEFGVHGGSIIIIAYEIIKNFLNQLNNVKSVTIISGNHDRLTPDKPMDKDGGAAQIISYMIAKDYPNTSWHPIILQKEIDNIVYIFTHGHFKLSNADLGNLMFDYGKQDKYNVHISAHKHTREQKKLFSQNNMILRDRRRYRSITIAPIVTGNRYSEEMDYSNTSGYTITQANDNKDNIHHFDFSV
ncbi:MAG: hypothetical protein ACK58U_15975 [Rubrivivax sp.]|jgi:metallophosphoesterase superfamily enzyme